MVSHPEVDNAVDEIVNEAICTEDDFQVKIDLSKLDGLLDDKSREIIQQEHNVALQLLDYKAKCYHIFRRWYIDGRVYYHAVIDDKAPQEGIKELRYIDPRKIREVKEMKPKSLGVGATTMNQPATIQITAANYYLYNEMGFSTVARGQLQSSGPLSSSSIKVSKDSIVHVPSGLTDTSGTIGLGFMHKAMRILTQLKTMEDSLIIYRLARAPERRVWYIYVGNLPRVKADQVIQNVMTMQKNRLVYDSTTGAVQDSRKFMTMLEDYWLPVQADGQGTKVDALPGGKTLGEIEDINYFQQLLFNSLNVPISRLQDDANPFNTGQPEEINRAEVKFNKFIKRLQNQFSNLFRDVLKKNLILKGLMSLEEFDAIEKLIDYEFAIDNHFAELKDQAITKARCEAYMAMMETGIIGKYYSDTWVRRNIFQQTEEDIKKETMQIIEDLQNPLYQQPMPGEEQQSDQQQEQQPEQEMEAPPEMPAPTNQDRAQLAMKAIGLINKDHRGGHDNRLARQAATLAMKSNPEDRAKQNLSKTKANTEDKELKNPQKQEQNK